MSQSNRDVELIILNRVIIHNHDTILIVQSGIIIFNIDFIVFFLIFIIVDFIFISVSDRVHVGIGYWHKVVVVFTQDLLFYTPYFIKIYCFRRIFILRVDIYSCSTYFLIEAWDRPLHDWYCIMLVIDKGSWWSYWT